MKPTSSIEPLANSDDAPELTAADLARAHFRIGERKVSREEFSQAVREQTGKRRVSIMLDASVVAHFKAKAGERGYQTLINQALRDAIQGEQMEETLRRVIREELRAA